MYDLLKAITTPLLKLVIVKPILTSYQTVGTVRNSKYVCVKDTVVEKFQSMPSPVTSLVK
jgi:hypothetical protein